DAQGPQARPGRRAHIRRHHAARRGGCGALWAVRRPRPRRQGFFCDHPLPARRVTPMVSTAAVIAAGAAAILDLLWPVAIFILCRRRMTLAARNVFIGAGVFFVFSQVLEKALHIYLLQLNPATAAWLAGVPIRYAIYGCLAAGLFEEIGRYLGMRFLVRPTGNPGTAVAYGLGHGGIEAVLLGGLAMTQTFVLAVMLNSGTLD